MKVSKTYYKFLEFLDKWDPIENCLKLTGTYRVSRKKVYPFASYLVNIKYKDLAHISYTIG